MTQPASSPGPAAAKAADAPAQDFTGRTLGDFRLLRKVGQGGMGQVYLAEQVSLKRKVALKILRPELAANKDSLTRFKAEAEAVAKATHANIVQVYAFGESNGIAYMALEFVEGRNLKEYLAKKGPPDLFICMSIMRQVAAALQRAGELGITHRDIKPENILLTRKGEVKVADFGLARCLEGDQPVLSLTQSGITMGTPLYMSPEQVEGRPLDPRSDIYSFGATCYHMLVGQPPYQGATPYSVAYQHVKGTPPPLSKVRPDLPEGLCGIVQKMMEKDPDQRYQTGRDLLRDMVRLRESLGGSQAAISIPTINVEAVPMVSTAPLDAVPETSGRLRHHAVLAGFAIGAVLLGAAAGALAGRAQRRSADPLPAPGAVPADARTVETNLQASKKEQALRESVELYLKEPGANPGTGAALCMDLAFLYLNDHRLDEAEKLFARLAKLEKEPQYSVFGRLGKGVVLALRDKPQESNAIFAKVFTGSRPQVNSNLKLTITQAKNPQWKYWLTLARWYNKGNSQDVTWQMQRFFPLSSDLGLPGNGKSGKGKRRT
jgi:serine/threonine-protein kinase